MMSKDLKGLEGLAAREAMPSKIVKTKTTPTPTRVRNYIKKTPERLDTICQHITTGITFKSACALSGISDATFYRWRQEDPEFEADVQRATALSEQVLLGHISEAALMDWRAAAWILERRMPDQYSAKRDIEVNVKENHIVETIQAIVQQTSED